jgi:acylphosphatase
MTKCLKIIIAGSFPDSFLRDFIQKHARTLELEGVAQALPDGTIRVLVCGLKDPVDSFLDALHKGIGKAVPEMVEVEPFVKDRDFRGVFRVLEG